MIAALEGPLLPPLTSDAFGFIWTALGLFVGSFLNVCIHRFPLDDASVFRPLRSHCPKCDRQLGALENIPVLSWLVQRGRCKGCRAPIHWRYPLVEICGAAAFYLSWLAQPVGDPAGGGSWPLLLIHTTVLCGLVVATFVDFDRYEIPDQVSIGGTWASLVVSALVPALHEGGLVARRLAGDGGMDWVASLGECAAGMAVGAGFLYGVGVIGKMAYKTDAMGFGDVKLMAAGGGFLGVQGVVSALVIAVIVASVAGLLNMTRFFVVVLVRSARRGRPLGPSRLGRALVVARIFGRYLPFGPYLALGIGIVLLDWKDVMTLLPFGA